MQAAEAYLNPTVLHWNYRGLTDFPLSLITEYHTRRKIKDIYLKENNISSLPRDICRLGRLESLYLSGNDISYIPKEIGLLRRLKCLDLSGNGLVSLPDEIGDMTRLQYLILDDNTIRELPLRIADLRALRYLSVCDNQLQWLPQRPVHNYHHCELRFWRNRQLPCLPYSLWYHMFRNQQIRALSIGCLSVAGNDAAIQSRCILKMHSESAECKIAIPLPPQYRCVTSGTASPPSLLELCKRELYRIIQEKARHNSWKVFDSIYADEFFGDSFDEIPSNESFLSSEDFSNPTIDNVCESNQEDLKENGISGEGHVIQACDSSFMKLEGTRSNDLYLTKDDHLSHANINNVERSKYDINKKINNTKNNDTIEILNKLESNEIDDMTNVENIHISRSNNEITNCLSECSNRQGKDLTENVYDVNANICVENDNNKTINHSSNLVNVDSKEFECYCKRKTKSSDITTSQLVEKYLCYLPDCLKRDLKNGPVSRCENVPCTRPVFDCAFLQFCKGKLQLIDAEQDVILSAVFCSNSCSQHWARLQSDVIPWDLADGAS